MSDCNYFRRRRGRRGHDKGESARWQSVVRVLSTEMNERSSRPEPLTANEWSARKPDDRTCYSLAYIIDDGLIDERSDADRLSPAEDNHDSPSAEH